MDFFWGQTGNWKQMQENEMRVQRITGEWEFISNCFAREEVWQTLWAIGFLYEKTKVNICNLFHIWNYYIGQIFWTQLVNLIFETGRKQNAGNESEWQRPRWKNSSGKRAINKTKMCVIENASAQKGKEAVFGMKDIPHQIPRKSGIFQWKGLRTTCRRTILDLPRLYLISLQKRDLTGWHLPGV